MVSVDAVDTHKRHEWITAGRVHREGKVLERVGASLMSIGRGQMCEHGRWLPSQPESSDQQGPDTVMTTREAV